jgi:hypothetical protein
VALEVEGVEEQEECRRRAPATAEWSIELAIAATQTQICNANLQRKCDGKERNGVSERELPVASSEPRV